MNLQRLKKILQIYLCAMLIPFLAFTIGAFCIGGDAVNGKVEDGHYYVRSKRDLTEVSRAVWLYSKIHVYSLLVMTPPWIGLGIYYEIKKTAAQHNKGQQNPWNSHEQR